MIQIDSFGWISECRSIFYSFFFKFFFIIFELEWESEWVWFGFLYILFIPYLLDWRVDCLVVGIRFANVKTEMNKQTKSMIRKSHNRKHWKFYFEWETNRRITHNSTLDTMSGSPFVILYSVQFAFYNEILFYFIFFNIFLLLLLRSCFSVNFNFKWRVEKFQSYTNLTLIYFIFSLNCRTEYGNIVRFQCLFRTKYFRSLVLLSFI